MDRDVVGCSGRGAREARLREDADAVAARLPTSSLRLASARNATLVQADLHQENHVKPKVWSTNRTCSSPWQTLFIGFQADLQSPSNTTFIKTNPTFHKPTPINETFRHFSLRADVGRVYFGTGRQDSPRQEIMANRESSSPLTACSGRESRYFWDPHMPALYLIPSPHWHHTKCFLGAISRFGLNPFVFGHDMVYGSIVG